MSRLVRVASLAALLVAAAAAQPSAHADAQPAPYHRYRTFDTPHFRVHVTEGLEREGRVAGAAAERAYEMLSRELVRPRGMIDLVVSDDADYANGNATPLPSNRINIFAAPPIENAGLRFNDDWLAIVVTHELAHVFHLDRSRGVWGAAQHVFGRAPFLFPNLYGPAWLTEGLAVYYESRLTEGGRLHEVSNRVVARAAAREGRLPRLDQLSLGAPGFPGGEGVYGYGALFLEYLARTRGDSTVGQFVERQSAQLIPFWLNRSARQGFGVSFAQAFDAWRDSVQRTVDTTSAPLPGWRQLTERSLYAPSPRWLNDSTIVYSGTSGRETNAAYTLTLGGAQRRLGRRDGRGANVPLADGSLLYSALDYVAPSEARSDLYRSWPDGRVRRLTTGARLMQPDARADGSIVAVKLDAARSSLVLLDTAGVLTRVLRAAAPDETWSEPSWSHDGRLVAAVRRAHGGEFSLEIIDVVTDSARVFDRGRYVIASPRWSRGGLVWTSERFGAPALVTYSATGFNQPVRQSTDAAIYEPEPAPGGGHLAAATLRADGYHIGVVPAPFTLPGWRAVILPDSLPAPVRVDTQPLAPGEYRRYSAWRSLQPRYWFPVAEAAASSGTLLGASTSGADVLRRHLYAAYVAIPTSRDGAEGALFYRYAGLRRPLLDVGLSQDWTSLGRIFDANGAIVGTLLKRTQDVSLAATFVRPRVRTYATLSAGLGLERRRFATDSAPLLSRLDTSFAREYSYPRAFFGAAWGNAQRPALSISPEDGIAVAVTARERLRTDAASLTASFSVVGTSMGYKSLDLPGFSHHVLALRLAGGYADRRSATALEVGGTSGSTVDLFPGYTVGEGRRTFGVRGFPTGAVYGTRAAAGSLEYRAPLALGGRGLGLLPLFFGRSSFAAFADAGVATCATNPLYPSICSPAPLIGRTIASAGAEAGISAAILEWDSPQPIRVGVAVPVIGRALTGARPASVYVAFGLSY
ncbi:MAG TPA: hypothetical protein VM033_01055 [Gemmatimonadaceae bacterium]|nr:hypothetical protein [Gemmatimonadaceae bacterium]